MSGVTKVNEASGSEPRSGRSRPTITNGASCSIAIPNGMTVDAPAAVTPGISTIRGSVSRR